MPTSTETTASTSASATVAFFFSFSLDITYVAWSIIIVDIILLRELSITFLNAEGRFFLGVSLSLPLRVAGALESRTLPLREASYRH